MTGYIFWQDPQEIHIVAVASLFLKQLEPIHTSTFKHNFLQLQQTANSVKAMPHLAVAVS